MKQQLPVADTFPSNIMSPSNQALTLLQKNCKLGSRCTVTSSLSISILIKCVTDFLQLSFESPEIVTNLFSIIHISSQPSSGKGKKNQYTIFNISGFIYNTDIEHILMCIHFKFTDSCLNLSTAHLKKYVTKNAPRIHPIISITITFKR